MNESRRRNEESLLLRADQIRWRWEAFSGLDGVQVDNIKISRGNYFGSLGVVSAKDG